MEKDKGFAAKVLVDEEVAILGMMVAGQKKNVFSDDFSRKRAASDTNNTAPVQQNKNKATVKAEMVGLSKDPVMLIAEFLEHMEKCAVAREEMCAKELEKQQLHWEELELACTKAALEKQQ